MSAHAQSLPITSHFFATDEQPKQSLGGMLIHWILAVRRRQAEREVLKVLSTLPDAYRSDFVVELERRLLGQ